MEEGIGAPPQALFDAMDTYIGEQAQQGHFLDGGGLFGTEDAVNFVVRKGDTTRVDGPYAEAKEVVGVGGPCFSTTAWRPRSPASRSSPSYTPSTGPSARWSPLCVRSRRPRPRRPTPEPLLLPALDPGRPSSGPSARRGRSDRRRWTKRAHRGTRRGGGHHRDGTGGRAALAHPGPTVSTCPQPGDRGHGNLWR